MSLQFPELSASVIEDELLPEVYHWALSNGLIMYPPKWEIDQAGIAPITLYPTPLPHASFDLATTVQQTYNELYAKIAQDGNQGWLSAEVSKLARYDEEFTGRLWDTLQKAQLIGISQRLRLGVFRSDYLVDARTRNIKQVEFNTISVSFGGLSSRVGSLHKFLNESGKYCPKSGKSFYLHHLPVSESATALADGLAVALESYRAIDDNEKVVLFIVQEGERNIFDQKIIEYNLGKRHGFRSVRMTLAEVDKKTMIDRTDKRRLFEKTTGREIGLVYFRSGYAPTDFKGEKEWDNRLFLETCYAIKAPDLMTQLAGAKKIQQLLTDDNTLSRFIPDDKLRRQLASTFVKIYPLDDSPLGKEGRRLALEDPVNYVLKPQREGGGNNIYKEDIPKFLQSIDEKEWDAYILMELIETTTTNENIIIRGREYFKEPMVSEFGVFGCILFDDERILSNTYSGWLLRSKFASSNEGGVAAGFGCVDSVVLY